MTVSWQNFPEGSKWRASKKVGPNHLPGDQEAMAFSPSPLKPGTTLRRIFGVRGGGGWAAAAYTQEMVRVSDVCSPMVSLTSCSLSVLFPRAPGHLSRNLVTVKQPESYLMIIPETTGSESPSSRTLASPEQLISHSQPSLGRGICGFIQQTGYFKHPLRILYRQNFICL